MNKVTKYLNQHTVGNVYDKPSILSAYATDLSPLEITPRFVALPRNTEDIQFLVHFANELAARGFELPIVVRGSGLDPTGADLTSGLVISTEHLNNVQEIDHRSRLVRVQAGATLEKVNAVLAVHGLTIPVKANPKQTIGGLISNFPTDPLAKKYGSIFYYTDRIEAVLATGELIQTTSFTNRGLNKAKSQSNFEGSIYRDLEKLLDDQFDLVENLSTGPRRYSGYRMATEVRNQKHRTFDLMPLFFAAQGTLGIITEVILRCEPLPARPTRMLATFRSIRPALDFANMLADYRPAEINLYDASILQSITELGKDSKIISKRLKKGYYICATFDERHRQALRKIRKIKESDHPALSIIVEEDENTNDFDALDSVLVGYLNNTENDRLPLVSSTQIPHEQLPSFITDLRELEQTIDHPLPIYGSYATSTFSVRPNFDFSDFSQRKSALRFIQNYGSLVLQHHGSLAGSHAEGRTQALVTNSTHSTRELDFYQKIKQLFDPRNILNPDVKLGSTPTKVVHHLRKTPHVGVMEE